MQTRSRMMAYGVKVALKLPDSDYEAPAWFPQVPAVGDLVELLDVHGSDPLSTGPETTEFEVFDVRYGVVTGAPNTTGSVAEEFSGHVGKVIVTIKPVERDAE